MQVVDELHATTEMHKAQGHEALVILSNCALLWVQAEKRNVVVEHAKCGSVMPQSVLNLTIGDATNPMAVISWGQVANEYAAQLIHAFDAQVKPQAISM